MSLRDDIARRSAELVKRETVLLPECGLEVQVRGLMSGEIRRLSEAKRRTAVQVALSTEDPKTGKLIWMPEKKEDLDEIEQLHASDFVTIVEVCDRLSGMAALGKRVSRQQDPQPETNGSPSPSSDSE